jgi:hypothetical protein
VTNFQGLERTTSSNFRKGPAEQRYIICLSEETITGSNCIDFQMPIAILPHSGKAQSLAGLNQLQPHNLSRQNLLDNVSSGHNK